jgi:Rieske Fe-S protein
VQGGLLPNREYGLAIRVPANSFPAGIFWSKGEQPLSVRSVETSDGSFLICVGVSRKSGQHDAREAMQTLEALARRHYPVNEIAFRWSAQNFRSPDGLPYIGRDASGLWIATGFGTDGLVYGTLAASIIADSMAGRDNRWSSLYRPGRFAPMKGARGLLQETASVTRVLLKDYLTNRQRKDLGSIDPGHAAVVEVAGERLAVYRNTDGELSAVSATCTHLGCRVHWNALEESWDCPCHGSRFAPDGRVLEGPALEPLPRKQVPGSGGSF